MCSLKYLRVENYFKLEKRLKYSYSITLQFIFLDYQPESDIYADKDINLTLTK